MRKNNDSPSSDGWLRAWQWLTEPQASESNNVELPVSCAALFQKYKLVCEIFYFDRYRSELNEHQKKVIDHVLENRHVRSSAVPFIVYGPFGTGKTLTLAEAAKVAVMSAPGDTRILICTHSNR